MAIGKDGTVETALHDSFPASDPPAPGPARGVRAAPAEAMMPDGTALDAPGDARTITRRFPDAESAKLALETLVREGPLDRRQGEITAEGEAARLTLTLPGEDRERLAALLDGLARPAAGPARVV